MAEITAREHTLEPGAELAAAVSFLTRIRVPAGGRTERTGAAAFGVVGLGLGLAAAAPVVAVGAVHPWPAAILALAIVAILDGGFHLDGLADTADALAAPAGAADRARTDPRSGSAGVVAVVLVLAVQAASIGELAGRGGILAGAAIVIAVTASRAAAPIWAVAGRRSVGTGAGLGRWFAERVGLGAAAVAGGTAGAVAVAAVLAVVATGAAAGPRLLTGIVVGALGAGLIGLAILRLRRQLDGDGYGALIELTVAAVLLAVCLTA